MLTEEDKANLKELGWTINKLAEVAGYYNPNTVVGQWKTKGKIPPYIRALLQAHVRILRLVLYGEELARARIDTPKRARRPVTAEEIDAYFAKQREEFPKS
jgi:hypothetical protein